VFRRRAAERAGLRQLTTELRHAKGAGRLASPRWRLYCQRGP
jgi:hypothetical protein